MEKRQVQGVVQFAIFAAISIVFWCAWITTTGNDNETWSGWFQALGSVLGIGVAVWVPYKQRELQRADERELRNISAAAFTLRLLPHVIHLQGEMERRLSDLDKEVLDKEDRWYAHHDDTDYKKSIDFITDNWKEISHFDIYIARLLITAIGGIKQADRSIFHENANHIGQDEEGRDIWELDFYSKASFLKYRETNARAHFALQKVVPKLEDLIDG